MLLSAVSVLVVAQSSSEIPEGLMNNPVEGMVGRREQRLTEAKREIADPAGNRIPVIQHVTSDAFVTVFICIGLLKSGLRVNVARG